MILIFINNYNNVLKIIDTKKDTSNFYIKKVGVNLGHLFFGKFCVSIFRNEENYLLTEKEISRKQKEKK